MGFWFDGFSIVANTHPQHPIIVPNVGFNVGCVGVLESITQQFAGDPAGLILEEQVQSRCVKSADRLQILRPIPDQCPDLDEPRPAVEQAPPPQ
jgi:hypothetical protein